ncbi:unnamed protein product [Paramecium primaurelia]|uniref:Uncharacterized protein n=1 Tax=Paramecium primaurelia TaxID=5886 RepID=A0A8S1JVY7_PARPR|nr:unnamed protein product [Paramecium primaurelia]
MQISNQLQLSSTLQQLLKQFYIPQLLQFQLSIYSNTSQQLRFANQSANQNDQLIIKEEYQEEAQTNTKSTQCMKTKFQTKKQSNSSVLHKLEHSQKYNDQVKSKKVIK